MAYTRLDLRNLVRRELNDTGAAPLWSDSQINDDLAAAFAWYTRYFPYQAVGAFSSGANQIAIVLGATALSVAAVIIDGATVPQVPDQATLSEPATRGTPSQTLVQPINPLGVSASHGQAWAFFNQSVNFRFPLAAGRSVTVTYNTWHTLPSDDVTAVTPPDGDIEPIVLYACDRLVRAMHTEMVKRGAPAGALRAGWADARDDSGYRHRADAALRARLRPLRPSQLTVLQ